MDKKKPYYVKPVNVSVNDKRETSVQDSGTATAQSKKDDLKLSSIGDLLPHLYR